MAGEKPRVPIAPSTKVADLLDSWPELEETLVAQAPAFRRLKNPVLRRTVARVATLEQAAGVGGVAVRDLVAALRRAAGIEGAEAGPAEAGDGAAPGAESPPGWLERGHVAATLDADALLEAGQVPLAVVNAKARALAPAEILRVDSGFRPVPLVEALEKQGFRSYVSQPSPGRFETFLARG